MEQSVEVGDIWFDKSGENPVIVLAHDKERQSISFTYLLTINGKLDLTESISSVDLFLKTKELMVTSSSENKQYIEGKTNGYNEGYQHGFILAKEKITELYDNELESIIDGAFQEGYAQAYSEIQSKTEDVGDLISDAESFGFREGYAQANRERVLQEKAWDEGYVSAIEDFLSQGDEFVSNKGCYEFGYEVGAEQFIKENMDNIKSYARVGEVVSIELYDIDCEHTPNKETQDAMQEVLDKVNKTESEYKQLEKELSLVKKYPHYYKDIRHLNIIDIYRFFDLFEVTDPCIQHSLKKMAVGGKRGSKDYEKDIKEAMDTLSRWEYMQEENKRGLDD